MAYHIIGDQDTVLGYRFAGVTGNAVETAEEARAAFAKAIARHEPGVLLLTEAVADLLETEVTAHRLAAVSPFLAVVQDIWGPRGKRRSLQELIDDAVGIHIVRDE